VLRCTRFLWSRHFPLYFLFRCFHCGLHSGFRAWFYIKCAVLWWICANERLQICACWNVDFVAIILKHEFQIQAHWVAIRDGICRPTVDRKHIVIYVEQKRFQQKAPPESSFGSVRITDAIRKAPTYHRYHDDWCCRLAVAPWKSVYGVHGLPSNTSTTTPPTPPPPHHHHHHLRRTSTTYATRTCKLVVDEHLLEDRNTDCGCST